MDRLQGLLDFIFDRLFVQLTKFLFLVLLMLPGFMAVLVRLTVDISWLTGQPMLAFLLARLDSGFQLGLGSFVIRGWLLVLTGLTVLIGVQVPRSGRALWILSWLFQIIGVASAATCSHPYEALLTVADTALLNVVILLAYAVTPRSWLPAAFTASTCMVAYLSLEVYLYHPTDELRLTGSFHQPNMTATYLAAALPWLINQYLSDRRSHYQLLAMGATFLILTVLLLTGTRAAWLFGVAGLSWRWWMGACLRSATLRWPHPLLASLGMILVVFAFYQGIFSWTGFLITCLLMSLAAWRSGLRPLTVLWLLVAAWLSFGAFQVINASRVGAQAKLESRVKDLSEATDISISARLGFWRAALLMGLQHPGLGVGPRGFHRYYPSYQTDERWFSKYAHSAGLSCWAEMGIPGTLVLVGLAGFWLAAVGRGLSRLSPPSSESDEDELSKLLDAATAFMILSLCSLVDVQWQFPVLPVAWAAWLGYSLALAWGPEPPGAAAPQPGEPQFGIGDREHQNLPVSPWTLRPRVVLSYFLIALAGVATAGNLTFSFAQAYADMAEELMRQAKVDEAMKLDQAAITLNPFQGSYFHHLGLTFTAALAQKKPVKLDVYLAVAQRAVDLDSHRAVHYDLLSKAYRALKKPAEARAALHRAIECDPINYPSFYTALAELAETRSQRERLLLTCAQRFPVESLGPMFQFRSADIVRQLIDVYLLLADLANPATHPEIALGYYDQLLKMQPDDLQGQMGRLVCLINLNRLKQAHQESLKLYYQAPRPETLDILKHVYQFENLPFDPTGLPPIPEVFKPKGTPTPAAQP